MISGGINDEYISLNDYSSTISKINTDERFKKFDLINKAKELIYSGKISEAELLLKSKMGQTVYKFAPMAKICIHSDYLSRISKYRRELRLDKAVHKVSFCTEGKNYTRESFISNFAQVYATRISCDRPKSVNFTISIEQDENNKNFMLGNTMCVSGKVNQEMSIGNFKSFDVNIKNGKDYCQTIFLGALTLRNIGGTIIYSNDTIKVIDADEAIVYFAMRTKDFEPQKNCNINFNDYNKQCLADIHNALKLPYFDLINQSIAEHKDIYDKCSISLEDERNGRVATDVRLKRHFEGKKDHALYPLMYNIGKYLAINCSHYSSCYCNSDPNGVLTDFTEINKNRIKFWPVYPCGLFEKYDSFLNVVENLYVNGKINAKENYHHNGWIYCHINNEYKKLIGKLEKFEQINFWRVASGWMSLILWNYYVYNNDIEYLKRIYPIISDAALFFKETLVKTDDGYVVPPSALSYKDDNSINPKMNYSPIVQEIVYFVFKAASEAQQVLKIENEYSDLSESLKRSDFFKKGIKSEYAEMVDLDEYSIDILRLTGCFKFNGADYMKKRLQKKIIKFDYQNNKNCTIGWKVSSCAYVLDAEQALEFLDKQLQIVSGKSGIINMYDYYTKYFVMNPAYGIIANVAICIGMINMLIQVDNTGKPVLLPALPKEWPQGRVSDIRIPGNKKISFSWQDGKIADYKIESTEAISL